MTDAASEEFVERLRARIDSDPSLTPAGLAVRAGLDNSAIRSILSGRSKTPKLSTVMKICAALGTTIEEFMGSPQNEEERDMLRLLSQLTVDQRRQLLGYGEALRDLGHRGNPEGGEEDQGSGGRS